MQRIAWLCLCVTTTLATLMTSVLARSSVLPITSIMCARHMASDSSSSGSSQSGKDPVSALFSAGRLCRLQNQPQFHQGLRPRSNTSSSPILRLLGVTADAGGQSGGGSGGGGNGGTESAGTDFWFAFPASGPLLQDWQPVRELVVQICGITQTTGTVTVPGLSYSASFSIPSGGGLATVTVPASCQMSTMDGIENSAVHVVAGAPVQVQASDWLPYMSEGFMAMPSANVGNNYVVVAYPTQAMQQEGVSYGSGRFSIVAVADNTTATITPSVDCGSHLAGVPFTVTLSTGQAYELMEPTVGSDLTGTTITSDNNVVVFGGAQGAYVPIGAPQANPLTEQIPSVDRL